MTSPYIAKRVQAGVPIWDILAHGQDIGTATIFDYEGEGPMATVRYLDNDAITFTGTSIHDLLARVGNYLRGIDSMLNALADIESFWAGSEIGGGPDLADAEYYSEVIGPMEAAERLAELRPMEDDPVF
jgi:hypothetical protein